MANKADDISDKMFLICTLMNSLSDSVGNYSPRIIGARKDSKESIKRKITILREELLNLLKMF